MKKRKDVPDLSKCYYIIFAANMADSVGLVFSDADYRDWSNFCRLNSTKVDGERMGIFGLWYAFLYSRGLDLCTECWNVSHKLCSGSNCVCKNED